MHKYECAIFKKALETDETTVPLEIDTVRLCMQAIIKIKVRQLFELVFLL